jgi:hypothetical protein
MESVPNGLYSAVSGFRFRGLQFLAENAHRAPRTKGEWYFYHKTKRYQMLAAGAPSLLLQSLCADAQ